ncbi:cell wall protein [Streptomyces sp. CS014]|uniref:cell wall protein n=1 Tax=Streptomyces sp. CS014 TaxID=2162707 RepID=UPI000D5214E2|nr:cell wall protein [Streptomyces sp. CS014]PVC81548.1 cell wall protein [Streptomyces sp. CS014]
MSLMAPPRGMLPAARTPEGPATTSTAVEPILDVPAARLVAEEDQDVVRTRSRRAEPRAWLRAVVWLVVAGLHPGAGPSTVLVARDLSDRMDYRRGLVVYGLAGVVERTGLSAATVKRHVRVLRELGALVWMVHGSKRNLAAPGEKYMATATIYGAVIPPAYDDALGHRLTGAGYEARVCGVTPEGRELAVAGATARAEARQEQRRTIRTEQRVRLDVRTARPVDNSAVDNACSAGREPHSLGRYHRAPAVDVERGCNYIPRERASCRTTPRPAPKISWNSDGSRRTAAQTRAGIAIVQQVRPLVNWTQREGLRPLEVALRPLTDAGWDAEMITAQLHSWMLTWNPARPAAYIRARLAQQAAAEHAAAAYEAAEGWDEAAATRAFTVSRPELVLDVMRGLAEGMAAYSARQAEQGLDDLTDADAAADMAAFLERVAA